MSLVEWEKAAVSASERPALNRTTQARSASEGIVELGHPNPYAPPAVDDLSVEAPSGREAEREALKSHKMYC